MQWPGKCGSAASGKSQEGRATGRGTPLSHLPPPSSASSHLTSPADGKSNRPQGRVSPALLSLDLGCCVPVPCASLLSLPYQLCQPNPNHNQYAHPSDHLIPDANVPCCSSSTPLPSSRCEDADGRRLERLQNTPPPAPIHTPPSRVQTPVLYPRSPSRKPPFDYYAYHLSSQFQGGTIANPVLFLTLRNENEARRLRKPQLHRNPPIARPVRVSDTRSPANHQHHQQINHV
ncbi:hypothetical protein BDP67DRAFT_279161 [Colletotrichum lupini]|nr:hypothetical protein BDP67DRAFT_279161 [Colletotrichum lupini]